MGLASDVRLRSVILGIKRIEVLFKTLVSRHARVDRATNLLLCIGFHDDAPLEAFSRSPKNLGPFQRVPVMAKATLVRLGYVSPLQAKPWARTAMRCISPFHSRANMVPGRSSPAPRRV